jgi:hypothetical protein
MDKKIVLKGLNLYQQITTNTAPEYCARAAELAEMLGNEPLTPEEEAEDEQLAQFPFAPETIEETMDDIISLAETYHRETKASFKMARVAKPSIGEGLFMRIQVVYTSKHASGLFATAHGLTFKDTLWRLHATALKSAEEMTRNLSGLIDDIETRGEEDC